MPRQSGCPPHCSLGMSQRIELWALYLPVKHIVASNAFVGQMRFRLLVAAPPIPLEHRFAMRLQSAKNENKPYEKSGIFFIGHTHFSFLWYNLPDTDLIFLTPDDQWRLP